MQRFLAGLDYANKDSSIVHELEPLIVGIPSQTIEKGSHFWAWRLSSRFIPQVFFATRPLPLAVRVERWTPKD